MLTQIAKIHSDGLAPATVRVRDVFVRSAEPAEIGAVGSPVASRMRSPNGQALRLYLQSIFLAQCEHRPGSTGLPTRRPLIRAGDDETPAWSDLVAPFVNEPPSTKKPKERTTVRDRVVRQLQSGLETLDGVGLVEIGKPREQNRYDQFLTMSEGGRGYLPTPAYYVAPRASYFEVPAAFFTGGWLWAMTNTEIAAYLMFRHIAKEHPRSHASDGIYVYGEERENYYGLPRDAYEAHHMLRRFGLVERMANPWYTEDGKIIGIEHVDKYQPLKFKLIDAGLAEPDVLIHVLARLEEP